RMSRPAPRRTPWRGSASPASPASTWTRGGKCDARRRRPRRPFRRRPPRRPRRHGHGVSRHRRRRHAGRGEARARRWRGQRPRGGGSAAARSPREAEPPAAPAPPAIAPHTADGIPPEGEPYLVMEWIEGESLAARVASGRLDVAQTLAVGKLVADALAVAHER